MSGNPSKPPGWLDSLRRIGASVLAIARGRLELFSVEWQEEKLRLVKLFVWLGVAAAFGFAGMLVALGALTYWLWTVSGYLGVITLAVIALAAAVIIVLVLVQKIKAGPTPFAETVAEFRKDAECLKTSK